MDEAELKGRTKAFALRAIKVVDALPHSQAGRTIGRQLVRSATSVGANYRAACRGRSRAEFVAKLGVALEEADESAYWIELIMEAELVPSHRMEPLLTEANELTAILTASIKSTKRSQAESKI